MDFLKLRIAFGLTLLFSLFVSPAIAQEFGDLPTLTKKKTTEAKPIITPTPPTLSAKSYILLDVDSGKILASHDAHSKQEPASLTKMMTLYIISEAIKNERLHLDDTVRISKNAWKTGGSRMFVKVGQDVSIQDLIKGIIVHSGNDASVALAEHIAGSESGFADLMNQQAQYLGMKDSHFTSSTGMPNPEHYTTAYDLALLARSLINEFPDNFHWYKMKWFTFNGIKQPNRNRLLWRDEDIDGIKTGHTKSAGFCLAASASKGNMRLLAIVLGSSSEQARADDAQNLLNYGYRFFETHHLYDSKHPLVTSRVWFGMKNSLPIGLDESLSVTIPVGSYKYLKANLSIPKILKAPIKQGQSIGQLKLKLNDNVILSKKLIALDAINSASLWRNVSDKTKLFFYKWFGMNTQKA